MASRAFGELQGVEFQSLEAQYSMLPSYVEILISKGNLACVDEEEGTFKRFMVVYWEGAQCYRQFKIMGLQLDGTHIKSSIGGVLLVACLRDSNCQITIVSIAVVSVENEDNWSWFIEKLAQALSQPAFVISDRDKGLIKAMQIKWPGVPHCFCFRHLMENFNSKFKVKNFAILIYFIAV